MSQTSSANWAHAGAATEKANLRISFLHTIAANQSLFEEASIAMGLSPQNIRHELRADLREAAEARGALTDDLRSQTVERLLALASESDVVVLTCATLGPAADGLQDAAVAIVRADTALAHLASAMGGKISVLCAAESALASVRRIYDRAAPAGAAQPTVVHLPHVWNLFRAGEREACFAAIASSARAEYEAGADIVTLAHPWMAPAAKLVTGSKRPLDIPSAALELAVERGLAGGYRQMRKQ
ncbi:MAG: Asp/Glu racemase [Rhizobiaceae bacterium]|nr:Asp/Glu racemase [Rhizobiaceae bacterium]